VFGQHLRAVLHMNDTQKFDAAVAEEVRNILSRHA